MWVDRYGKISGYEPEYEAWWRLSVAKEHQASYSVEWPDILPYLAYPHSDDIFIIFHCWFKVWNLLPKLRGKWHGWRTSILWPQNSWNNLFLLSNDDRTVFFQQTTNNWNNSMIELLYWTWNNVGFGVDAFTSCTVYFPFLRAFMTS